MLKALKDLFATKSDEETEAEREDSLQLATAVLLVEMSRADYADAMPQDLAIVELLKRRFALSDESANLLLDVAQGEANAAVSLHEFTRLLNENLNLVEKHHVIEMLWQIAMADQELHKYEDALVRKIADLLYVSHRDLVRLKHRVIDSMDSQRQ